MRLNTPDRGLLAEALLLDCVISALAAAALWTIALVRAWPRLMAGESICGAPPVFLGHCPECFPAMAATAMAVGFTVALAVRRRARF